MKCRRFTTWQECCPKLNKIFNLASQEVAIKRNQKKALTLKYSCSRALSAAILFLGSYVRNLKIQNRKPHSLQLHVFHLYTVWPARGQARLFFRSVRLSLSIICHFFPRRSLVQGTRFLKVPVIFGPRNHILKSKRTSYLTNQFILTAFPACESIRFFRLYFHPLSEEEKRRPEIRLRFAGYSYSFPGLLIIETCETQPADCHLQSYK